MEIFGICHFLSRRVSEGRKMEKKCMDKFIGKYCKIVATEPGEERAHVVFGMVTNIDHDTGLLVIESNPGLRYLKIETIVAIKPKRQ